MRQTKAEMKEKEKLEALFRKNGCEDFKWIEPEKLVVSQWVRMKCMFGCPGYGQCAACPPHAPSISDCERFLREYSTAAVFHFAKKLEKPEDRHEWGQGINRGLLELERAVFLQGYRKAFLFFMDTCGWCKECAESRDACKNLISSRPAPEAFGIDVFATVRQIDYPIEVLTDFDQTMNRYAFLLIE